MIRVFETKDTEVIKAVVWNPDIWDAIAEDNIDPYTFEPDLERDVWLSVTTEPGDVLGVFNLHSMNGITIQIHAMVLPQYRKTYSKAIGEAVLKYIYKQYPHCAKILASVPEIYPNVIRYLENRGFMHEGINRSSYEKNGKIWDQHWYGITRKEIKEMFGYG